MAAATKFRVEFGLDADPAYIVGVAVDPAASTTLGVPLLPSEVAELDSRNRITSRLGPLVELLNNDPNYAGIYQDQQAGGEVVVAVTDDGDSTRAALASALPIGAVWRIAHVPHSAAALKSVRDQVEASEDVMGKSLGLSSVWIDSRNNRVSLGLDPYTDEAASALIAKFGDLVDVSFEPLQTVDTCTRQNCPTPMKGGLDIYNVSNPLVGRQDCTSGFMSRRSASNPANSWFMLTAGHCLWWTGGNGQNWNHFGNFIGSSLVYQYCDRCSADVGVISMKTFETPTNRVFASGSGDIRGIIGRRSNATQTLGAGACRGGESSNNYLCGTIDRVDQDVQLYGPDGALLWHNHRWRVNVTSQGGDSGGPVMWNFDSFGVVTGGQSATWYSTLDWINSSVGYQPCITASSNPCS